MRNTILQRVKKFLTVKMVNLEKIKKESFQPSPPLLTPAFKKTCPCNILAAPYFNFSAFLPFRGVYLQRVSKKQFLKLNFLKRYFSRILITTITIIVWNMLAANRTVHTTVEGISNLRISATSDSWYIHIS